MELRRKGSDKRKRMFFFVVSSTPQSRGSPHHFHKKEGGQQNHFSRFKDRTSEYRSLHYHSSISRHHRSSELKVIVTLLKGDFLIEAPSHFLYIYNFYSTLLVYSPVSVLSSITSPCSTNKGTFIFAPLSKVTVFVPPWALSPLIPGGASITFN